MSASVLKLIPTNPQWTPADGAKERARNLLRTLVPDSAELKAVTRKNVEFIDQGENFERVLCPGCRATLETDWWQEAMDKAFEGHFEQLDVRTPCCRKSTSLNDLQYEWPAGFAKFSLEARDPNRSEELKENELRELEEVLGCKLRQIWANY